MRKNGGYKKLCLEEHVPGVKGRFLKTFASHQSQCLLKRSFKYVSHVSGTATTVHITHYKRVKLVLKLKKDNIKKLEHDVRQGI